jgi:hypothetical protein
MVRELTTHKGISPVNDKLQVQAIGSRGPGGAPLRYDITGHDASSNPARVAPVIDVTEDDEDVYHAVGHAQDANPLSRIAIVFQSGEPAEVGFNGVTMESLLAIVKDRLEGFQDGPYPCAENDIALKYVTMSLDCLRERFERLTAEAAEPKTQTPPTEAPPTDTLPTEQQPPAP